MLYNTTIVIFFSFFDYCLSVLNPYILNGCSYDGSLTVVHASSSSGRSMGVPVGDVRASSGMLSRLQ